jgi:hypothetical protein
MDAGALRLLEKIAGAVSVRSGVAPPGPRSYVTSHSGDGHGEYLRRHVLTRADLRAAHDEGVARFAAHMIASMYQAGLDRRYGDSLAREVRAIVQAADGAARNRVVDYGVVPMLTKLDVPLLGRLSGEHHDVAAQVCSIGDRALHEMLGGGGGTSGDAGAFAFTRGVTDPNEAVRRAVGEGSTVWTASVETYLAVTLCDPYAYGVSGTRAVFTFVAFLILRCKLRKDHKTGADAPEPNPALDRELDNAPDLVALLEGGGDGLDWRTMQLILGRVETLPSFRAFLACMSKHRADDVADEQFHALYTVLKATYVVHFAAEWVGNEIEAQLLCEAEAAATSASAPAVPDERVHSDATVEDVAKLVRDIDAVVDTLTPGAPKKPLTRLQRASAYQRIVDVSARLDDLERVVYGKARRADDFGVWHKDRERVVGYAGGRAAATKAADFASDAGKSKVWVTAVPVGVYGRPPAVVEALEAVDEIGDDDMLRVAGLLKHYAGALSGKTKAATAPAADAASDRKVERLYRLRPVLGIVSRVYSFLYRLLETHHAKQTPAIVTMLRRAGWREARAGVALTDLHQQMFESLTRVMAGAIRFCHDRTADALGLVAGVVALRTRNMRLMGALQRQVLSVVPACHPFRFARGVTLTLPASVAASIVPRQSTEPLPPQWNALGYLNDRNTTIAQRTERAEAMTLMRAILGEAEFEKFERENTASVGLIKLIAKGCEEPKAGTSLEAMRNIALAAAEAGGL